MSTREAQFAPDLDAAASRRLDELVQELVQDARRISTIFPAAARVVARGAADPDDPDGLKHPRLEDQARVVLLVVLGSVWADGPERFAHELAQLYRYGDADERRAVLRALSALDAGPGVTATSLPLVEDALRTNDVRLVAAAMGSYGAHHLDPDSWRQGVLKCLFVGVPLEAVADLDTRADDELARMVADYCRERAAAGRSMPTDAWRVLDRFGEHAADVPRPETTATRGEA
ncbi:EboA domain-containing protein [Phytoactinopolyspora endophytica]|uniref:EboA domain-containing protein n=1 Tax=Phytoactinopolyspora endophytica TaxID=1642495 RepID=UPI00101C301D|nr:EboA domain-containing protein [Phytoactinopolyspora endophytica]